MAKSDILEYHDNQNFPSHGKATAGLIIVFGAFIVVGSYALMDLWAQYGAQVMSIIESSGLPDFLAINALTISLVVIALVLLSIGLAIGASILAKRLGGTLIYIGAAFMNIMTWGGVIFIWAVSGFNISVITASWPIMIPGIITLFTTILLLTVFRDRVKRAGEIVKLTGQVCLDEKGLFVPTMLTMIFTLVSALLFGAIIFRFTPAEVLLGNQELTIENGWPLGLGMVIYLFVTIFFYNFAYGTASGMVYIYMRGRDPSLGDGVKSSLGVLSGLIVLSIMSVIVAIVRMIIRAVSRRSGAGGAAAGRFASGAIGWVWALVNFFTIPAMVAEELGAKDGIKRSANLVKDNFVDVMIKETAVRWAFAVLAVIFFIAFGLGGAVIGWIITSDIILAIIVGVVFSVFAGIPSSLVLRTFDIVYVTLLYVFIRRKEGEIRGKTAIPSSMEKELNQAYSRAQRS
jgi:hypothetical protein